MITYFWLWWRGFVTVRLRGPGLERLLNKIAAADIVLWQIERRTPDVMLARFGMADFCRLRPLLWGTRINVSILDRHGLPFLLRDIKRRLLLPAGLALCLAFIVHLAGYIWFVEIHGHESLSLGELRLAAEELGLNAGVRRASIAPRRIEKELLLRFPSLAWAEVELKGVRARLSLSERNEGEGVRASAGHIYATEDGVVTQVLVLRGTARVGEGDTVQAGELLISGDYYDARGQKQFGSAEGIIRARVWHEEVGEAPLVVWRPLETGVRRLQYLVSIGPWVIPVGKSYSEETHLRRAKEWSLSLGAAMVPISLARVEYAEVEYVPTAVPIEQARLKASAMAWEKLSARGVDREQIRAAEEKMYFMPDQDGVRISLTVEAEQEIGLFLNQ
ncbi:MAG TPA: sporulation protein YqfD [Firmicutes bacterium]|nr:sporulation protein YqfD [Bacillota bacterium]